LPCLPTAKATAWAYTATNNVYLSRMSVVSASPSPSLAPFVKQYWGVDHSLRPGGAYDYRLIPTGLTELTFYLGYRPEVSDINMTFNSNSLVSGHLDRYYDLRIKDSLRMFSVSFKPQAVPFFLKAPARLFFNANVPLADIIGTEASCLEDRLYHCKSFTEQVRHMETFLCACLEKHYRREPQHKFAQATAYILRSHGNASVNSLASMACQSLKQYERCFADQIGCSPKQFLRIVRFQYSLQYRKLHPRCAPASLAAECGYYDQSHMNRDFRDFTGMSPGRYFSRCNEGSDLFS